MAEITVGELLMQCLHAEGVEMMAGIIDGAHIPFVVHAERTEFVISMVTTRKPSFTSPKATRVSRTPAVVFGNRARRGQHAGRPGQRLRRGTPGDRHRLLPAHGGQLPDRGGAWQAADLVAMAKPITKYAASFHAGIAYRKWCVPPFVPPPRPPGPRCWSSPTKCLQ